MLAKALIAGFKTEDNGHLLLHETLDRTDGTLGFDVMLATVNVGGVSVLVVFRHSIGRAGCEQRVQTSNPVPVKQGRAPGVSQ